MITQKEKGFWLTWIQSANKTPQKISIIIRDRYEKITEFDADFESIEKVWKKLLEKSLRAKRFSISS